MKGSRMILALLAAMLVTTFAPASAQDEYMMTVNKTSSTAYVVPPTSVIRYETIAYTFYTPVALNVRFESVDVSHVKLTVKAASPVPYSYDVSVQWLYFPPVTLGIDGGGTGSFILNTETGYAEK
ncbi:MAG: hypothetical protein C4574_07745 [Candidatus Latescibacterota bacterium]|nr:MAG: hypothetical protein C4574_07745 [Candidatus Latescibacterota bacterium]